MRKWLNWRLLVTGGAAVVSAAVMAAAPATAAPAGAAFTTDNPGFGETSYTDQACLNGPAHTSPEVNCNIYPDKRDVWINGGPSNGQNHLTDGSPGARSTARPE